MPGAKKLIIGVHAFMMHSPQVRVTAETDWASELHVFGLSRYPHRESHLVMSGTGYAQMKLHLPGLNQDVLHRAA